MENFVLLCKEHTIANLFPYTIFSLKILHFIINSTLYIVIDRHKVVRNRRTVDLRLWSRLEASLRLENLETTDTPERGPQVNLNLYLFT